MGPLGWSGDHKEYLDLYLDGHKKLLIDGPEEAALLLEAALVFCHRLVEIMKKQPMGECNYSGIQEKLISILSSFSISKMNDIFSIDPILIINGPVSFLLTKNLNSF